jgi:hypothetical protein
MEKIITFVLLLGLPMLNINASGIVPEPLKQAIKNGNAKEMSKYFNSAIELDLLGKDEVYNRNKAEQVIGRFFAQYPIINFSVIFEGGKDVNQYAIGKLITSKGVFRVTILLKESVILQLRVEEDNGN